MSDVAGYGACVACGNLEFTAHLTALGGVCAACTKAKVLPVRDLIVLTSDGPVKPRRPRRGGSRGDRQKRHVADRAQRAALRRLRQAVPDLFWAFLALEREQRGLDPWPVHPGMPFIDQDNLDALLASAKALYERLGE